jgi:hypothetical protein
MNEKAHLSFFDAVTDAHSALAKRKWVLSFFWNDYRRRAERYGVIRRAQSTGELPAGHGTITPASQVQIVPLATARGA